MIADRFEYKEIPTSAKFNKLIDAINSKEDGVGEYIKTWDESHPDLAGSRVSGILGMDLEGQYWNMNVMQFITELIEVSDKPIPISDNDLGIIRLCTTQEVGTGVTVYSISTGEVTLYYLDGVFKESILYPELIFKMMLQIPTLELSENKVDSITLENTDKPGLYPTVSAVKGYVTARIPNPPTVTGFYSLTCEVTESGVTYAWNPGDSLGIFS